MKKQSVTALSLMRRRVLVIAALVGMLAASTGVAANLLGGSVGQPRTSDLPRPGARGM